MKLAPSEAWGRSLAAVLLGPLVLYGLAAIMALFGAIPSYAIFWVIGAGVGVVIHFISYLLVGLPIYLVFWETKPELWTFRFGLILGIIVGGLSVTIITLFNGVDGFTFDRFIGAFLFGGLYGLVTAIAAILSAKNYKNEY